MLLLCEGLTSNDLADPMAGAALALSVLILSGPAGSMFATFAGIVSLSFACSASTASAGAAPSLQAVYIDGGAEDDRDDPRFGCFLNAFDSQACLSCTPRLSSSPSSSRPVPARPYSRTGLFDYWLHRPSTRTSQCPRNRVNGAPLRGSGVE